MSGPLVAMTGPGRFWTRFGLLVLGAMTIAAVEAAAFVVAALEYLDGREGTAPPVLLVALWLLVVLTPVAWSWASGGRRLRWFSAGAATSLLIQLTYFLALALAGTGVGGVGTSCAGTVTTDAEHARPEVPAATRPRPPRAVATRPARLG